MADIEFVESAYDHMGRRWLGLGNLAAPCWFVGLEPGGVPAAGWPERWQNQFGAPEVIHARADADDPDTDKFFGSQPTPQKTWQALIRVALAYAGEHSSFLKADGREALLELSGYPARSTETDTPREKYTVSRVFRMRELMAEFKPDIVVCYGTTHRTDFEYLCGGPFEIEGRFRWSGSTLCAMTPHPQPRFRAAPRPEVWTNLGAELASLRRHSIP
jgi:hypothetical protein